MNTPILSPDQVWETALNQLRIDIPLNAFNNWLQGTQGISFENNTFVIGTANPDVRELLESRLTSTASHLISGILDQPVSVQFIVQEKPDENELEVVEPAQSDDPNTETPKVLTLQAEYQSVYDEIVQPDQVIVFPGYFLRYIPILGQELAWMYIGFRQAAYEAGAGRKPGKKVGAPAKKVARFAGMSLRTFWRWAAKPETWKLLRWLVEPVDEEPHWKKGSDGWQHRATRFYRVSMSLPLTPFDELSLHAWVYRKLAEGKSQLDAIRIALDTPVSELLPWPERILFIEENSHEPHSVQDLLSTICNPIPEADQKLFHELVEKLVHYLMPSKHLVFLTHYFVQHWLPQMGVGPGWFVTLMRDRCNLNLRTGEIRDEVRLEQGYAEAAQGLGLKRDKTIWEWLRSKDVATFVRETGREEGKWESAPRYFKVCLGEPMIPGDQERASLSLAGKAIGASDTHGDSSEGADIGAIGTFIGGNGSHHSGNGNHNDAVGTHKGGNDSQNGSSDIAIGTNDAHIGDKNALPSGANGTFVGASDTHMVGANGTSIGAFGTIPWGEW